MAALPLAPSDLHERVVPAGSRICACTAVPLLPLRVLSNRRQLSKHPRSRDRHMVDGHVNSGKHIAEVFIAIPLYDFLLCPLPRMEICCSTDPVLVRVIAINTGGIGASMGTRFD